MQSTDDPVLLLDSLLADPQKRLQLEVILLHLLQFLSQPLVIVLQPAEQALDLIVLARLRRLLVQSLTQLLVLVLQFPHVVLEQVNVLPHPLHLLLVLLDPPVMFLSLPLYVLLQLSYLILQLLIILLAITHGIGTHLDYKLLELSLKLLVSDLALHFLALGHI